MKSLYRILILVLCCTTAVMALAQTHGINPKDMDPSVRPGDDFYQYAGGGWMKANPLSPEYSSYGVFNDLAETNRKQLMELINDLNKTKHPFGSNAQKVIDLYNLAMDSTRRNAEGAKPIQADLQRAKTFKKANLTNELAYEHMRLGNPFFGIGVESDPMNSKMNALYISPGTMGLPDRDYYLKTDAESKKIQQQYRDYITKMFTLCGYGKADAKRAARVVYDMEYAFAQASLSRAEQRDFTKLFHFYSFDQLVKEFPAIDWKSYFKQMGLGQVTRVILMQPKVMAVAQKYMASMPEKDMRLYLAKEIIDGGSGNLSDEIEKTSFDFYGRVLSGQKEQKPRWKRALGYSNGVLGMALGQEYVKKFFPAESKAKMLQLIGNLRKSLAQHIAGLTWMSDSTKINALVKLNAYTVKVGYPDKWKDYSKLTIDPKLSLYDNMKAVSLWATLDNLKKMGKPVDREEWGMTPQTVNAYYNPMNNEIVFPAAILQAPFFDPKADDATNYGAIGVVIGHEMTHGFDDQGRQFNAEGNFSNWWSEADAAKFKEATEKLAAQFDKIEVLPGLNANGHLTLGENIADQGGLRVSFDAFRTTQQFQEGKKQDGFTPAQRFFLSYGRIWAENGTDEYRKQLTLSNEHSLGCNRVNATLRNIDVWYDAFGIHEGDKLYMAPADRAIIW